jgi:N-acetylneuraminate synthase/sialic acid synthase
MSVYFIVEIGQNHQGDIRIAKKMVDTLVGSGVSAIKTAKRDIETCLTEEQKRMPYENPNSFGKTYYDHRKALELSHYEFEELKNYIEKNGFDFIPSFTDIPSFDLINKIGCEKIKIASQRVTDIKLLQHVANEFDGAVYMSSGMSNIIDINKMIDIFKNNEKYLLQCTSVYPCPENLLNLSVLKFYKKLYLGVVDGFGFSGHHAGIAADLCAYLFGAKIIERHFTLNRAWKGTDHAASLGIDGILKIIKYIDQIDDAIGISDKYVLPEELPAIKKLRSDLL